MRNLSIFTNCSVRLTVGEKCEVLTKKEGQDNVIIQEHSSNNYITD
jgi:hypothetical protein